MQTPLRDIVVGTKNHVDIGFTEPEGKVLHDACRWLLPTAARQAARMRREESEAFCWIVPAFIAELALEWLDGDDLRAVEDGFASGDLAWHGLPFTLHTELADQELLDAAAAVARRLDARFGVRTTCAKMTDVPGHTVGLVTALARAGIESLHVGVNWMSPRPDVPSPARWRDPLGNEIVLFSDAGYAGTQRLPGEDRAFVWDIVGDNMEVPSAHDVRAALAALRERNPGAHVRAGRPEAWAGDDFRARAAVLPVVSCEIGDSWIFGTGSDPWKTQRFRALLRLRRAWLAAHRLLPASRTLVAFDRELLLVAEHTWGGAVAAWTHHDRRNWSNAAFARVRTRGCWRALEASWQEKRDHVDSAVEALPGDLRAEALLEFEALAPVRGSPGAGRPVRAGERFAAGGWSAVLDAGGALTSAVLGRERLAAPTGLLRYRTFDAADCARAVREYATFQAEWLLEEFAKLGVEHGGAVARHEAPRLLEAWLDGDELRARVEFPAESIRLAGAPATVWLGYVFRPRRIEFRCAWFDKAPTRLPEALEWTFAPEVAEAAAWRVEKCGHWIDPCAVAARGGRWLHGVGVGARNAGLLLRTPDAHLVQVGRPMLGRFPDEPVDPRGGVHLALVNNLWGTNFPQWCGDDLAFRAALEWEA